MPDSSQLVDLLESYLAITSVSPISRCGAGLPSVLVFFKQTGLPGTYDTQEPPPNPSDIIEDASVAELLKRIPPSLYK